MAAFTSTARVCTNVNISTARENKSSSMSLRAVAPKATAMPSFSGLKISGSSESFLGSGISRPSTAYRAQAAHNFGATAGMEAGVGIYGDKAGMTQIFTEDGKALAVTVISLADGNVVTQVKTPETDGYTAVQVGYRGSRESKMTQPELGHLAKSGSPPLRHLGEFRVKSAEGFESGKQLQLEEMFSAGDLVDIQGTSIGKGFQGGIKRHGFKRGLMTHGSKSHREHGSTGPGTTPGRIYPGSKQAGQMGNKTITVRKLEVVRVDAENRCMLVKGSVPGKPGNMLRITPAKIVGKNV
ncbi:Plastid ribosomal protein L3, imported to chloroplast, large ribosomal subunit [Cymbomonas tetramitiformis]|uniref:Large ribosomal subunit protein uL3c n=1 Tax=Cymbomonas tetramitiformis TaxID=36881 RepID=A0AAE0GA67_9CHLO|nr:Plastid ribosomal protein L3, imported to chloroplast, large ribosomal subunit [Cymbomonas tetramitiformis]|eukprot:gene24403-29668_t